MELIFIVWKPIIEAMILWFIIYKLLAFIKGTRAVQVLRGIVIIIVVEIHRVYLGAIKLIQPLRLCE